MASVQTKMEHCPRCSQPTTVMDVWPGSVCGFCKWKLADPGIECVKCGTLNFSYERECDLCHQLL